MKNNASLTYNICLVVGDFLALIAAFVGGFLIRAQSTVPVANPISGRTYLGVFLALLPFWILIFALLGLYNSSIYEKRFVEVGRLFVGSFIGLLFVIFWNFLSTNPIFPAKLVPIYGFVFGFVFLVIFRTIARLIRTELFGFKIGLTRIIIVGSTAMTRELVDSLRDSRRSGYQVVGVVAKPAVLSRLNGVLGYEKFQECLAAVQDSDIHGIIQTELYKDDALNTEILEYAQEHHINYRFVPGNSELFVGNIDVELFRNSIPVINVRQTALFGWGRVVKRMFDIVFGGLLLLLSSPLWLLVALLIKISDPHGPVFYKANRLSRFGSAIKIYKFRSIKHEFNALTPEQAFKKLGQPELAEQYRKAGDQLLHDPRISRVGRLLRATSLDELPQLFNVVKGDISLVGPRALDAFEMERYSKKHSILSVKSGLTGLALVSNLHDVSFEERRRLDVYYVQNWSFWLDITILTKTVRVVLERIGRGGSRY